MAEPSSRRAWPSSPRSAGLFLDFDGTLSEIAHVPSDARPLAGVPALLGRLAGRFSVVAVVSGRSAHELLGWLGPDVEIWGVHGAQRVADGRVVLSDRAAPFEALMRNVGKEASERLHELGLEGVMLEDKEVVVALHFRAAADVELARTKLDALAEDLARRHGLTRGGGRLAFELRPPVELSKKFVVRDRVVQSGLEAAAFVGDDRVDLGGFEALDELEQSGLETLRVAVDSPEAPPELLARADVVLRGPAGVVRWLESLLTPEPG